MTEYHVRNLDEALTVYARERIAGRTLPTFTVDASTYETFEKVAGYRYTIHAKRADGSPVLLRHVLLHFRPVGPDDPRGASPPRA